MTDILTIDYTLLSSSLTEEEIEVLQQYQKLAQNLTTVKKRLDEINNQITNIHDDETMGDTTNLTALSVDLQKSLSVLGTMFKTTVHNVLMHVDSNQIVPDVNTNAKITQQQQNEIVNQSKLNNDKQNDYLVQSDRSKELSRQQHQHALSSQNQQKRQTVFGHDLGGDDADDDEDDEDDEDEDDVDLGSGIDEETMNAVDRIQHELGISADDVDIHRQIADQLEINNNNY